MNTLQFITTAGTTALAVLSAVSLLAGGLLMRHRSAVLHAFGLMTLLWGVVNGLIALAAYARLNAIFTTPETIEAATGILRMNLGLDLVYFLAGVLLLKARSDRGTGFGLAVALQGILLFLIDLSLLAALLSR